MIFMGSIQSVCLCVEGVGRVREREIGKDRQGRKWEKARGKDTGREREREEREGRERKGQR